MKIIKVLCEQIAEEVEGAREYAICALEYRYTDPDLSKVYHNLSQVEYEHAEKLHEFAERKVAEAQNSGFKYPEEMKDKYDKLHQEMIVKMKDAKVFIDMF